MADLTYPLYPIFAFLGFFFSLVPLPWHLQAWNSGTCYFMMWSSLACLNQFINSVVWHNNALNPSPIWCEISIRILMGASVGIPAASLCINRRLYHIASIQAVSVSRGEKRRDILVDTGICVVFPIVYIALQYIVQGHRYDILEDLGCQPALYNTLPTYFISYMWPILIGLVSGVYCVLSLRSFIRRRVQFSQFLSSNKSLTAGRYFRLMALATTEILLTIPLASFVIWLNTVGSPIGPWVSWADTHFHFFRIEQIPAVLWRINPQFVLGVEISRWSSPLCAFVFFGFFGFAAEAQKNYKLAFWFVVKPFGFKPPQKQQPSAFVSIGRFVKPKAEALSSLDSSTNTSLFPSRSPTSTTMTSASFPPPYKCESETLTSSASSTPNSRLSFGLPTPNSRHLSITFDDNFTAGKLDTYPEKHAVAI